METKLKVKEQLNVLLVELQKVKNLNNMSNAYKEVAQELAISLERCISETRELPKTLNEYVATSKQELSNNSNRLSQAISKLNFANSNADEKFAFLSQGVQCLENKQREVESLYAKVIGALNQSVNLEQQVKIEYQRQSSRIDDLIKDATQHVEEQLNPMLSEIVDAAATVEASLNENQEKWIKTALERAVQVNQVELEKMVNVSKSRMEQTIGKINVSHKSVEEKLDLLVQEYQRLQTLQKNIEGLYENVRASLNRSVDLEQQIKLEYQKQFSRIDNLVKRANQDVMTQMAPMFAEVKAVPKKVETSLQENQEWLNLLLEQSTSDIQKQLKANEVEEKQCYLQIVKSLAEHETLIKNTQKANQVNSSQIGELLGTNIQGIADQLEFDYKSIESRIDLLRKNLMAEHKKLTDNLNQLGFRVDGVGVKCKNGLSELKTYIKEIVDELNLDMEVLFEKQQKLMMDIHANQQKLIAEVREQLQQVILDKQQEISTQTAENLDELKRYIRNIVLIVGGVLALLMIIF